MKKVILSAVSILFFGSFLLAQTSTTGAPKIDLTGRAADHLMIQFGSDAWTGKPDSVKTSGFSRHFNIYFMYDVPFKSDPHYSVAFGLGIGTSNIFLDDHTFADVKSTSSTLPFRHLDSTASHFSKQKLTTMYLQAPVELRYFSDPAHPNKSWKSAVGVKIGTLLKGYSKAKNYVRADGSSIYGSSYIEKEYNKRWFDATDVTLTGRFGYGIISLDAGYQVTGVFRDGLGPVVNKFSIGLTISGL
ncbi:MAG: outer membrane beta-barrel protein [Chitinophagia bacterium]|jgi:Outer membrane protein beta-barrel domain